LQGWYIVTYALAIYLLNLFIAFITPKFDPSVEEEDSGMCSSSVLFIHTMYIRYVVVFLVEGPTLPTKSGDEFKPFIRRLPEFKFW